ncbi:hypothetical protein AVEN_139877-1 [Araneus ventricosus]|uniref:Uncharacterized protein n=1 Tax=Araneus ventricosus TaxID=182803 RepID=A0A4Y2FLW2_ARAVE|nr:hypothetical protein AVEN_139877-1 [Araneus ventricosus]
MFSRDIVSMAKNQDQGNLEEKEEFIWTVFVTHSKAAGTLEHRWQKEWDNGETGRSVHNVLPKVKTTPTPWRRPEIMFVTGHGPFPTYLKRFNIRSSDSCGCGNLGNPLHYATSCLFTTSYHLTKPSADLQPLWWKRGMNNNNSRAKIRKLIHFIAKNETLLFPKDGDNN